MTVQQFINFLQEKVYSGDIDSDQQIYIYNTLDHCCDEISRNVIQQYVNNSTGESCYNIEGLKDKEKYKYSVILTG